LKAHIKEAGIEEVTVDFFKGATGIKAVKVDGTQEPRKNNLVNFSSYAEL
jgi:hypothetical protein